MCTLSFLPGKNSYLAAMNRDEQRSRPAAFPPAIHPFGVDSLIYPSESSGGTWIGANSHGTLLALLNAYSMEAAALGEKSRSRGELIPLLLKESEPQSLRSAFQDLDLRGVYPFRLFGFFPATQECLEWTWDTQHLAVRPHVWGRQHWFSSSRSDAQAAVARGAACARAWKGIPSAPAVWLRELHAGHIPEPGPFSICVHREDAATVSYTEVEWKRGVLQMRYLPGNPCQAPQLLEVWSLPAREAVTARG